MTGHEHPRWGIEFDWLAVDRDGHVAQFSTAGYGPCPPPTVVHASAVDEAIDQLAALPNHGTCLTSPLGPDDHSDWIRMAERGVYGFDWVVWHGPYRRLTVPSRPRTIDQLDPVLASVARLVQLDASFARIDSIDPALLGVERTPAD